MQLTRGSPVPPEFSHARPPELHLKARAIQVRAGRPSFYQLILTLQSIKMLLSWGGLVELRKALQYDQHCRFKRFGKHACANVGKDARTNLLCARNFVTSFAFLPISLIHILYCIVSTNWRFLWFCWQAAVTQRGMRAWQSLGWSRSSAWLGLMKICLQSIRHLNLMISYNTCVDTR